MLKEAVERFFPGLRLSSLSPKEEDRHVGVRQNFYLSDYEDKMVKDAMSSMGYTNKSQFFRDAILKYALKWKLGKEMKR